MANVLIAPPLTRGAPMTTKTRKQPALGTVQFDALRIMALGDNLVFFGPAIARALDGLRRRGLVEEARGVTVRRARDGIWRLNEAGWLLARDAVIAGDLWPAIGDRTRGLVLDRLAGLAGLVAPTSLELGRWATDGGAP